MIVTEEQVSQAIQYLSETDGETARLYGLYKGLEDSLKTVYGMAFSRTTGAQEFRKAKSYTDPEYIAHLDKINSARIGYETLRLTRSTSERLISVWQSENANRRAGVIL